MLFPLADWSAGRPSLAAVPLHWRHTLPWLVAFYLVFAVSYSLAMQLSAVREDIDIFNLWPLLDYGLKAIYTLPIWWLLFRRLRHWPLWQRILLTAALLPLFVKGWQQTYYWICESLDHWHLMGGGEWWDIYIPGLFYVLQFGIFYAYDYYRDLQQAQLQALELHRTALQSELTALKAQLNPHFLYNSFNTINASVPAEQEETRELVATLADLFRYQLRVARVDWVPLEDELNFVQQYLRLEHARFGDRLRTQITVPPALLSVRVPPMLLQPLVENAIRHGISPLMAGGEVSICLTSTADQLHCKVSDTGVGLDNTKLQQSNGIGLHNTRRRLQLLYGTDLHLQPNLPHGLCISFTIPIVKYATESIADRRRSSRSPVAAGVPE